MYGSSFSHLMASKHLNLSMAWFSCISLVGQLPTGRSGRLGERVAVDEYGITIDVFGRVQGLHAIPIKRVEYILPFGVRQFRRRMVQGNPQLLDHEVVLCGPKHIGREGRRSYFG